MSLLVITRTTHWPVHPKRGGGRLWDVMLRQLITEKVVLPRTIIIKQMFHHNMKHGPYVYPYHKIQSYIYIHRNNIYSYKYCTCTSYLRYSYLVHISTRPTDDWWRHHVWRHWWRVPILFRFRSADFCVPVCSDKCQWNGTERIPKNLLNKITN